MKKKKPIKQPVQNRAKKTRERILKVSKALISEEGIESFNTNRVASDAYISVATLYQYFANKEAIIDELIEDYLQRASVELRRRLQRTSAKGLSSAIKMGLGIVIELFHEEEHFFINVISIYQNPLALPGLKNFEQSSLSLFSDLFEQAMPDRKSIRPSLYVAYQSTMAVLSRHLVSPEPGFSDDMMVNELSEMICAYLKLS